MKKDTRQPSTIAMEEWAKMRSKDYTPTKEEVGYVAKAERYTYAPGCSHMCSGNCRRVGCNCECGEFHGFYED